MAKLNYGVTPTSVILRLKLLNSSVTTGAGLAGLTSASAGLIIGTIKIGEATSTAYTQAGATIETITTLGTYEAPTATKCRFKEVDATNHPGLYEIHLADARFAATGSLIISVSGAANLAQCDVEVQTSNLNSNLTQILGTAVSAPATAGILDINIKNIANAVVNTATAQIGANVVTQANIDFGAAQKTSLNAATPASVQNIPATGTGLTTIPWNAAWDVEVESECTDALNVYDPPTRAEATTDKDAILADHTVMKQKLAGTFDRETDSLEALRDRGDAAWSAAAGNPTVLIDTTIAVVTDQTHFTLTAGSDIDSAYLDQAIVVYDASNSNYPSVRKVSAYAGATKTVTLDSAPGFVIIAGDGVKTFVTAPGTTAPTVGQVADGVWDELIADHTVAGSTANTLSKNGKKTDRNFAWLLS